MASSVGPDPALLSAMLAEEEEAVRLMPTERVMDGPFRLGSWSLSVEWSDGSQRKGKWREDGWRMISTAYAAVEVDIAEVFAAMDLEQELEQSPSMGVVEESRNRGRNFPWDLLPSAVLDRVIESLDLVDIMHYM